MTVIATFAPTARLAGKKITEENGQFVLEGQGRVLVTHIKLYDSGGHLVWVDEATRTRVLNMTDPAVKPVEVSPLTPARQSWTSTPKPWTPPPKPSTPTARSTPEPQLERSKREILDAMLDKRDVEGLYLAASDPNRRLSQRERDIAHWYLQKLAESFHSRKARKYLAKVDAQEDARLAQFAAEHGVEYPAYHESPYDYAKLAKFMRKRGR